MDGWQRPSSNLDTGNNASITFPQTSKWSESTPYFDTQDDLKETLFVLRSINQILEGAAK